MKPETIRIILLFSPILIGVVIAIVNNDKVNKTIEKAEAWIRLTQSKLSGRNGWFSRYISNPIFWIIVKFSDWTDGFTNQGIKNGTRVTATLYFVTAWLYLLFLAFVFIAVIAIGVFVLYIVFKVLSNSNDDVKRGFEKGQSVFNSNNQYRQEDETDSYGNIEIYSGDSFTGKMVGYIKNDKVYQGGVFTGTLVGYIDGEDIYRGGDFTGTKIGYLKGNEVYRGGDFTGTMIGYIDTDEIFFGGTFTGTKVGYTKGGRRIEGAAALLLLL